MTSPTANQTSARLEATFGLGREWTSQAGQSRNGLGDACLPYTVVQ